METFKVLSLDKASYEKLIEIALKLPFLRRVLSTIATKKMHRYYFDTNVDNRPIAVQEEKFFLARNLLNVITRISQGNNGLSPNVTKVLAKIVLGRMFIRDFPQREVFKQKYKRYPPDFMVISPSKACNLKCIGCYANSDITTKSKLNFEVVDRIITEKNELWGSFFTVITGGEPFIWKDNGKGLLELGEKHQEDTFFLVYTNGTLINEKVAQKLGEIGNITPAISVEGYKKETDVRRGEGTYNKILAAFEHLASYQVPYGASVTITKKNIDLLLKEDFYEYYFEKIGVRYMWMFQYMPIGREYTLDLMITPEQRLALFEMERKMSKEKGYFIVDFWNSGIASDGCMSAGRESGHIHIDWNGNIMPCVFFPYYSGNIVDIYSRGGNLNDALQNPFFDSIRKWQAEYSYNCSKNEIGNLLAPCPMRDHHKKATEIINKTNANPQNSDARDALQDEGYHRRLVEYGENFRELSGRIWETEYKNT